MSIALQEFDVQQFRAEIAKMSDAELIKLAVPFAACAIRVDLPHDPSCAESE